MAIGALFQCDPVEAESDGRPTGIDLRWARQAGDLAEKAKCDARLGPDEPQSEGPAVEVETGQHDRSREL